MLNFLILAVLAFINFAIPAAAQTCEKSIQPAIQELNAKIKALDASIPDQGRGAQVKVGSCASRLAKLVGNFYCCQTFANTAPIWEEISCLELKKHYLQETCSCGGKALEYSTDTALQDSVLETYVAVRELRKKAISVGIPNKVIRQIVKQASEIHHCFSLQTLTVLRETEDKLTTQIEEHSR